MTIRVVLVSMLLFTMSCAHAWDSIDVTANPDVVRGCRRLGSVQPTRGDKFNAAMNLGPGAHVDWTDELKEYAYNKGGDTLFFVGGGSTGEAYQCHAPRYPGAGGAPLPTSTPNPYIIPPPTT